MALRLCGKPAPLGVYRGKEDVRPDSPSEWYSTPQADPAIRKRLFAVLNF
jgi:hypothetical protein